MKIGIITFWESNDNYGQLLQCWALQQQLIKMGHEPFLIRYSMRNRIQLKKPIGIRLLKAILVYPLLKKVFVILHKRRERKVRKNMEQKNRMRDFDAFRRRYITCGTIIYNSLADLQQNPPEADCYITGSDQVWAQLLDNAENEVFFLNFGKTSVRRIAYAPSFSMVDYPNRLLTPLKNNLQRFDYLSVREMDGVKICRNAGRKVTKVVDPTLLLSRQEYLPLLLEQHHKTPYVYVYSLNISSPLEIRWEELSQLAKYQGKDMIVTTASGYIAGRELFEHVNYAYATIPQWLTYIRYADIVVTSSFHGIVFCILLETPFVYVPLKGKYASGNNRIFDLLEDVGLEKRILTDEVSYPDIFSFPINWETVEYRLCQLREDSIYFLQDALHEKSISMHKK